MAVAVIVDNPQGSEEIYKKVRAQVGLDAPAGGIFHAAGPSPTAPAARTCTSADAEAWTTHAGRVPIASTSRWSMCRHPVARTAERMRSVTASGRDTIAR